MSSIKKNKIIAILGTTASGKTTIGVHLAYKFNGEIVSADSRQVYIGMDIGSGKDICEYTIIGKNGKQIEIPYHLIDVVHPNDEFNLAKYQKLAYNAIEDILSRNKLPILVGGTGMYAQSIIDGYNLYNSGPDIKLRSELENKSIDELFLDIEKENKKFANNINESDKKNKRRLVRYLEILKKKDFNNSAKTLKRKKYDTLLIAFTHPMEILTDRIRKRLIQRLDNENMVGEIERLHDEGVKWTRLEKFGLEYKWIAMYLQNKVEYEDMIEEICKNTRKFAKRQLTWLKRWEKQGAKINWFNGEFDNKDIENIVFKYCNKTKKII